MVFFVIIATIAIISYAIYHEFFKKRKATQEKSIFQPNDYQTDSSTAKASRNTTSLNTSSSKPPAAISTYKDININGFSSKQLEVLKRLNKISCDSGFGGIINAYDNNIPQLVKIFEKKGLVSADSFIDNMALLTVEQLKDILRDNDLKVSGKKDELISRIQTNIPRDSLIKHYPQYGKKIYTITETGRDILDQYYVKKESLLASAESQIYNLILCGETNSAFRLSSYFLLNSPIPKSIFVGSKESTSNGLSSRRLSDIDSFISNNPILNRQYCAIVVTAYFLDEDFTRLRIMAERILHTSCGDYEESTLSACFDTFKRLMSSTRDLRDYFDEDISFYRFLASLDGRTCEVCGALDGKVFPVSEAKIGINYPPMHNECRCTTVAVMSSEELSNLQRRARNPKTGEKMLVPANMTYKEWKSRYFDKS